MILILIAIAAVIVLFLLGGVFLLGGIAAVLASIWLVILGVMAAFYLACYFVWCIHWAVDPKAANAGMAFAEDFNRRRREAPAFGKGKRR